MELKEKLAGFMMGKMDPEEKRKMMGAMMDRFFSDLTAEDRQKMMDGMMDKFMASMSPEEKQSMMRNMMPKMMGAMSGGGGMMGNMMSMMMGMKTASNAAGKESPAGGAEGPKDGGEPQMDMCRKMMSRMMGSMDLGANADQTDEMRPLFEEWMGQIEEEVLAQARGSAAIDIPAIAKNLKLSESSVATVLTRLARKGKIEFHPKNG